MQSGEVIFENFLGTECRIHKRLTYAFSTEFSSSVDNKRPIFFDYNWKDIDDMNSTNSQLSDEENYDN